MTDSPSTEKATGPPQQPWQRFTLLDALLLQAGFAVGFSLAGCVIWSPGQSLRAFELALWIVAGTNCGAVLSAPLVLTVQWCFRGRQGRLSRGEWLWLGLFLVFAASFLAALLQSRDPVEAFFYACLMGCFFPVFLLPVMAARHEFRSAWRLGRPVPCGWTDAFGTAWVFGLGVLDLLMVLYGVLGGRL